MKNEKVTISSSEKLEFIGSLSTMLTAGIPILEVVNSLREDMKGGQKIILDTMFDDLMQGKHVHQTLIKFTQVFDKVTVNVIKASEEAGTLDITLRDLKRTIQKDIEFNDKVRSSMMYPMFIIVVFAGVLLMILTFVVPKISTVFLRMHVVLPLPTRIMIFVSDLLLKQTVPFLLGFLVITGTMYMLYKRH